MKELANIVILKETSKIKKTSNLINLLIFQKGKLQLFMPCLMLTKLRNQKTICKEPTMQRVLKRARMQIWMPMFN